MFQRNRLVSIVSCSLAFAALGGCDGFSGVFNLGDGFFTFTFTQPSTVTERNTDSLDVDGVTLLRVVTRNGDISVAVDDAASVARIESRKSATGQDEEAAEDLLSEIEIFIDRTGDSNEILEVIAMFPDENSVRRAAAGVQFEITLPAGMELDLETDNGALNVAHNVGDIRALTSNGRIDIAGQSGHVDAETTNGGVDVDATDGDVRVRTSNGSVGVKAEPPEDGTIDVETTNGRVVIEAPQDFAARLDIATVNGIVLLDLVDIDVNDLRQTATTARATLNGGGGEIRGRTTNGSISFSGF